MLPDDDPRHGTPAGRKAHRRANEDPCRRCKDAAAKYQNLRELDALRGAPRAGDDLGTRRRIQALVALGWCYPELAARSGVSGAQVHKWAKGGAYIRATSRDKIVGLYEALSMTHPPSDTPAQRRNAKYARTIAAKRGWPPPLAWDDIDDPNERPDMGVDSSLYRSSELVAEWEFLRRSGVSMHTAAGQLGVSVSAIEKAIERVGKVAA